MHKFLIGIGSLSAALWGCVSVVSRGLPQKWCEWLDFLTGHLLSGEVMKMANGFYYDTPNSDMPTVMFLIIFAVAFILMFVALQKMERVKSSKGDLLIIIVFSILFRLILLPSELIHENDIYRYLWDGKSAGSISNVFELLKQRKRVVIYLSPEKRFVNVYSPQDVQELLKSCDSADYLSISKKINLAKHLDDLNKSSQESLNL